MAIETFHPVIQDWFRSRFDGPTEPQAHGWPHIASGEHTLIAAPTGSGKTLTAFLAIIDRLFREGIEGTLSDEMRVVYVSPLRALSNDMHRNLETPLEEILAEADRQGIVVPPISVGLRTGDTPSHKRAALVRRPPHIFVTTPESLFLMLTAEKSREVLRTVDTLIVDEIHALVRDKRGSHLSLSMERLAHVADRPLQRIGISATQKPIERTAAFLVGNPQPSTFNFQPTIVDVGHQRDLDLGIEVPPSDLSSVCSHEQWAEVNERLVELIEQHRSTLIFVNTRRLAERLTFQLTERLGEEAVGAHHGSLSADIRLTTERKLKSGQLKAVVATASLELGIDVGYIDLVIQMGSPRSIATFLQRIGRSGHALGLTPKGRLFALTRDELIECMSLIRAVKAGRLDVTPIPEAPLDILAQQIVAEVAAEEWETDELFDLCRRAYSYRNVTREQFDEVVEFLSEGITQQAGRSRTYLHHDRVNGRLRARKGARITAVNNAGAIPEIDNVRVVMEPEMTVVGSVDEDFAVESSAGDIFLLGNTSWRIQQLRGNDLIVSDAHGAPPTIPFWRGEAPGRTVELSEEVSRLREEISAFVAMQR
ncbi:MAG: DEAD/DEAH box helicase [Planctomycetaceae bacterium]|nr:DEAD/DEAH box helicase [Planctomycetaceae bacterium]